MKQDDIIHHAVASYGVPSKSTPLHGGDINSAFKVDVGEHTFCIKINSANLYPGMFEREMDGLNALRQCDQLRVPEPISVGELDGASFLLMEYIPEGPRSSVIDAAMGTGLAAVHKMTESSFGWDTGNYIGSLRQSNDHKSSWADFFIEQRLQPQIRLAEHLFTAQDHKNFSTLFSKMDELFPEEAPALLHGDLWGGNAMATASGEPCIYDPAVYYGNREMDIAMTKLFGGFGETFYQSYQEAYPLHHGWKERIDLCNLYPLLVHVNLFGGSYLTQVRSLVASFV